MKIFRMYEDFFYSRRKRIVLDAVNFEFPNRYVGTELTEWKYLKAALERYAEPDSIIQIRDKREGLEEILVSDFIAWVEKREATAATEAGRQLVAFCRITGGLQPYWTSKTAIHGCTSSIGRHEIRYYRIYKDTDLDCDLRGYVWAGEGSWRAITMVEDGVDCSHVLTIFDSETKETEEIAYRNYQGDYQGIEYLKSESDRWQGDPLAKSPDIDWESA